MKNNRGSLTMTAFFTMLIFSLYGILLYARSASAYIRQSKSIETIKAIYAQDVPNAVQIAQSLGSTSTYIGEYCSVTFNANNGSEETNVDVIPGQLVDKPSDPIKTGVDFDGWYYLQESGTEENPVYTEYAYNFNSPVTSDITIYAKYKGEAVMMARNDNKAFWQSTYRKNISSIEFKQTDFSTIPSGATTWDVQADENCSRIAAYVENDGEGGYELTILSPNTIYANTNAGNYFYNFTNVKSIILDNFDTSKTINMYSMFRKCSELTNIDLGRFNTMNITNMSYMFRECNKLENLNLEAFNTSKVTNMMSMFTSCGKLTSLDLSAFDTSKVTNMQYMFLNCSGLTNLDLSSFNTANVIDMTQMFSNCKFTSLNISSFNTSKVINMQLMFYQCSQLTSINLSNFDTKNVTNMNNMFFNCLALSNLDLSNFNTSKVTDMSGMFYNCRGLTNINLSNFDTSNVTNMKNMFYYCNGYTSLDLSSFNTSKVTNMNSMFYCNTKLVTIYVGDNWDTASVLDSDKMFDIASKLVGSAGTVYRNTNPKDKTYAHVDGGASNPGYFTLKVN